MCNIKPEHIFTNFDEAEKLENGSFLFVSPLADKRKDNFYLNWNETKQKWFFNCLATNQKGDLFDLKRLLGFKKVKINFLERNSSPIGKKIEKNKTDDVNVFEEPLTSYKLQEYIESRSIHNIPYLFKQSNPYEMGYLITVKNIGGGYVFRGAPTPNNPKGFKGNNGDGNITIEWKRNATECFVVEGIFDYASLYQFYPDASYIILNSTTNAKKISEYIETFLYNSKSLKKLYIALDNDKAGQNTIQTIKEIIQPYFEPNIITPNQDKDWNDMLMQNLDLRGYIYNQIIEDDIDYILDLLDDFSIKEQEQKRKKKKRKHR